MTLETPRGSLLNLGHVQKPKTSRLWMHGRVRPQRGRLRNTLSRKHERGVPSSGKWFMEAENPGWPRPHKAPPPPRATLNPHNMPTPIPSPTLPHQHLSAALGSQMKL